MIFVARSTSFEGEQSMRRPSWLLFLGVSLFVASLFFNNACGGRPQEYTPDATIKEIMLSLVDPSADVVWEAVSTTVGPNGTEEKAPQNDEEWAIMRQGAIRLIEAHNLLMVPGRRVARPGEKSEAPGIELEPEEMEVLINKDREGWNGRTRALREAGLGMLQAIESRDREKIFAAGEQLESACENCHLQYWYPNQVLPPGYGSTVK
jgi:hypothetical protein